MYKKKEEINGKKKKKAGFNHYKFWTCSCNVPKTTRLQFLAEKVLELGDIPGSLRIIIAKCHYILPLFMPCPPPPWQLADMSETGHGTR